MMIDHQDFLGNFHHAQDLFLCSKVRKHIEAHRLQFTFNMLFKFIIRVCNKKLLSEEQNLSIDIP